MIEPSKLLGSIPKALRDELLERYREVATNYIEHRWEPSELNGGKFAEVVFSIAHGAITEKYAAAAAKPSDFAGSCRALEAKPANLSIVGDRSLRVLIPRALTTLYEIRNNRGVGHVGGDVNPNAMDASAVYSIASWVLAELVRVFHGVTTDEAQASVDFLAERVVPAVWIVPESGIRRVLETELSAIDQTVLLLHVQQGWLADESLCSSIEYSRLSDFRSKVLVPLHKKRLIEYDSIKHRAHLTPLGAKTAETLLRKI